ncbi:MAG: hypothetical protein LBS91_06210 [Clostridiales Family XIII bacterium]|nr:hypothetical protein [Clostridiales Family XIII bacterium]
MPIMDKTRNIPILSPLRPQLHKTKPVQSENFSAPARIGAEPLRQFSSLVAGRILRRCFFRPCQKYSARRGGEGESALVSNA